MLLTYALQGALTLAKNGAQHNKLSTLSILKGNFSLSSDDNKTVSSAFNVEIYYIEKI